jgi:hypothetical protein
MKRGPARRGLAVNFPTAPIDLQGRHEIWRNKLELFEIQRSIRPHHLQVSEERGAQIPP